MPIQSQAQAVSLKSPKVIKARPVKKKPSHPKTKNNLSYCLDFPTENYSE